jgi:hypothetical protein
LSSGRAARPRRHLHEQIVPSPTDTPPIATPGRSIATTACAQLARRVAIGAALHDPEQRLAAAARVLLRAALEPASVRRTPVRASALVGRIRRALVERHDDVGAERLLDLDRALGVSSSGRAVDLAREAHAAVGDLGLRQREHLEAAAVGEDRSVPAHERVQPPSFATSSSPGRSAR